MFRDAQGPVQFYNMPYPHALSKKKNRKGSHWLLNPVDFRNLYQVFPVTDFKKAGTIMFRNDFTCNLNECGVHQYAGVLSRGRRLPKIRQCT